MIAHYCALTTKDYESDRLDRTYTRSPKPKSVSKKHYYLRPVPFGELFAVLGSNAGDPNYAVLLKGTNIMRTDGLYNTQNRLTIALVSMLILILMT